MNDIATQISALKRPKLLVTAAQAGLSDYKRNRDLQRVFKSSPPLKRSACLIQLLDLERHLNQMRKVGDAAYKVSRHIDVLVALIAEGARHPIANHE